jgi:NADH:ubiquinone oxidoreductase subunit E
MMVFILCAPQLFGKAMGRDIILNILHRAQEKNGYLSEDVLKKIAVEQNIPISRLWGVAKFYSMMRTSPHGKYIIHVCGSPSCVLNNGNSIAKQLEKELGIRLGETTKDGYFSVYRTSCIGCCDGAPAMLLNDKPCTRLTPEKISKLIRKLRSKNGLRKNIAKKGKKPPNANPENASRNPPKKPIRISSKKIRKAKK